MLRQGRVPHWLTGGTLLLVAVTRWTWRSHELFSWDSANFAMAMADIDIAAHRPHPPGYIGYVLAARVLDLIFRNPNLSLVAWNMIATAAAAGVLIWFAWEIAEDQRRLRTAVAAALMFLTSPLIWFYGEVAEIYASELLVTLLVGFTAWRTLRGRDHYVYWCCGALALATVFKVSSAVMMAPLALYAWTRIARRHQWRSAAFLVLLLGAVGAMFLTLQPDLPAVSWRHFVTATSDTRLMGGDARIPRAFNRNTRDTLIATVSGLGVLNVFALAIMAGFARRLPAGLDRRFVLLWALPWILVVLTVHMAKPGYILPILPLAILVIADGFARLRRPIFVLLIAIQAITNVFQFLSLTPASDASVERGTPYRNKTIRARVFSDLQAITDSTAFTIRSSDQRVGQLRDLVSRTCPPGNPIIVVKSPAAEVDWRRVMWYFPAASAIRVDAGAIVSIATGTTSVPVPADGVSLATNCPIVWLHGDREPQGPLIPREAIPVAGLGSISEAGTVVVTPAAIRVSSPRLP